MGGAVLSGELQRFSLHAVCPRRLALPSKPARLPGRNTLIRSGLFVWRQYDQNCVSYAFFFLTLTSRLSKLSLLIRYAYHLTLATFHGFTQESFCQIGSSIQETPIEVVLPASQRAEVAALLKPGLRAPGTDSLIPFSKGDLMDGKTKMRFCMFAALLLTLVTAGLAHDRNDRDGYYQSSSMDSRQYGYENGHRDGVHHGREDRLRSLGYNMRSDDYKKSDRGYQKHMGNKGVYKAGYRQGYEAGYDNAYYQRDNGRFGGLYGRREDRYGRDDRYGWGNRNQRDDYYSRGSYNRVAFQNGYRDGLDDGQKDMRKNEDFDPNDHGDYRDADNGYKSGYGSKEAYKQEYRQGYLGGYREGFGARQYGRWR